ncbi:ECF subfamily RNA polymerase sigma-24 factor [Pseudomonas aeruginosa]|nr:ECF subfamily RNA polymerase sigma-24 factor [Pseudomonas aeruginosa]
MNGLLERLEKRQLDVVVGRLDNYAPRASLRCEVLYSEAIVVMARPGHPLAQAAALDWEDVRRYDWIVWPPGSPIRSKLDMALTQGGRQPPAYRLESSSMLANIELLRGSDMLSIGSARVVEHLAGLGLVARLALEIPGEGAVGMCWRDEPHRDAPARTCWPACAKARRPSRAPAGGGYCKKAAASRQCDSLSFMCRPDFPMSAPILLSAHHRAMHALYSEHHGWLQNWLRGKLGCAADAADLAQDTFLRILLKRELREIGIPRAFLRTIARGLVIDHWRREELQRAYLESIAHLPEAQAPSPEARELVLELLEEISRMLDGLKPKVRTAFLLAQCEDLSHRQIAERMGVSQRSVERYVAEALYHCYLLRYGE